MKKSTAAKSYTMTAAIYAIIFVVFNILVFTIFSKRTGSFWISYIFMTIAFVVQIVSMLLAFRTLEADTVFMGIPLASLSFYYFFAAMFVGAVFMFFQIAPTKLVFVLQFLILAIYAVVAIMSLMARDVVVDSAEHIKESAQAIKKMTINVDVFVPQVEDPTLKKALKKLSETIKYSDPMSNDAVADIEEQINGKLNELRVNIENGRNAEATQSCKDMEVLFMQRNSLLKATK